jgi:tellurite resistance protein
MVLDARLKKIAGGISAGKAARAFARSLDSPASLSDLERQQAEEFQATVEAMFLMAAADGHVAEDEIGQLSASIEAIADRQVLDRLELHRLLAELDRVLARDGFEARLADVARRIRTDDGRAYAFRLAAGVAFVDDVVEHAEAAAIEAFAAALDIDADESQATLREVYAELFGG